MTGCRRKLPKRTSDRREKGETGEEATSCILQGGSRGAPAFPRHGVAGALQHLLAGCGAQAPPGKWGNAVTPLSGWTHSGSPVTGAGLWVSNRGQPMAVLSREGRVQDQAPPYPQPGGWQVSEERGSVRTLHCSQAREGI